ncbi:RabGAP TBC [Phlebopus sp. FC_14]|nr:RabGAP TBC [Phlebopus sp. FC_14]
MVPADPSSGSTAAESPTLSVDAHRQRELKWMALLPSIPPSQARKNKKVRRLLSEGVPSSVRYLVWCHLTDSKTRALPDLYTQLNKRPRIPAFAAVEKDATRCFPDQLQLHTAQGPIASLLQAYLSMVPDVEYSSGLVSIAGQLLLLAPEEDAFWIFTSVMDSHLRQYFASNDMHIEIDATLFSNALESLDSNVHQKLYTVLSINPRSVTRPWFTTLFVGSLPTECLHRVWDIFLYEGITWLFRVGLVLCQCIRHLLLQASSEEAALEYLLHPPLACLPSSAESFLQRVSTVKMKDDDIRKQRVKMETQLKQRPPHRVLSAGSGGTQPLVISRPKT